MTPKMTLADLAMTLVVTAAAAMMVLVVAAFVLVVVGNVVDYVAMKIDRRR